MIALYYGEVEVEASEDPMGLGRVRVSVDELYGRGVSPDSLPWAMVASEGGGMPDSGSVPRLVKGASVLVALEHNNPSKPWVLCGVPKSVAPHQKYGDDDWVASDGLQTDLPQEAAGGKTAVVFKTPKGAALYVSEEDGAEVLRLVDRAGQSVEMASPVTAAANAGNSARRGTGLASEGTGLAYSQMAGPAYILATDLSGNRALLHSEQGEERVELENAANANKLEMTKDGVVLTVLGGQALGGLTIEASASGLKVNGQYFVVESAVDWIDSHKTALTISTRPGDREPLFPAARAEFDSKEGASVNDGGFRTKL